MKFRYRKCVCQIIGGTTLFLTHQDTCIVTAKAIQMLCNKVTCYINLLYLFKLHSTQEIKPLLFWVLYKLLQHQPLADGTVAQ